jgi:hypothetical protein
VFKEPLFALAPIPFRRVDTQVTHSTSPAQQESIHAQARQIHQAAKDHAGCYAGRCCSMSACTQRAGAQMRRVTWKLRGIRMLSSDESRWRTSMQMRATREAFRRKVIPTPGQKGLIDELQNRPFSGTLGSAFPLSQRVTFASMMRRFDLSQKRCQNLNLIFRR